MENEELPVEAQMSAKANAVKTALEAEADRLGASGQGELRAGLMYFIAAARGEDFEALSNAVSSATWD